MKSAILLCFALGLGFAAQAQTLVGQTFHANGRLQSTRYTEGPVERFVCYYADGHVQAMGTYRAGKRDGVWKQFAPDGTVLAQAHFTQGKRDGVWEFRDADNTMKGRLRYAGGRLASGEQFDPQGELVAQRTY
jgi:antitoxin component YwqK of YwqJK toxin-antitoxin module